MLTHKRLGANVCSTPAAVVFNRNRRKRFTRVETGWSHKMQNIQVRELLIHTYYIVKTHNVMENWERFARVVEYIIYCCIFMLCTYNTQASTTLLPYCAIRLHAHARTLLIFTCVILFKRKSPMDLACSRHSKLSTRLTWCFFVFCQ